MANYPPPPPGYGAPPSGYGPPPQGFDPRAQRRYMRDQARAQRDMYRAQAQAARYRMRSMRRTSILGPLLLIAMGVVFLLIQIGRMAPQHLWDWYARWWPSLFLVAGVILLAEWGWDQYRQSDATQPQYRRTLGGGVFTLLFLVAIAGFGANQARMHLQDNGWYRGWHLNPDDIDQFLGDKHESDQTLDLALPAGTAVEVMNPRGDVTLSGTSDDGHIHIAVHKQVYSRSDSDAEAKAQRLSPSTNTSGSTLMLSFPTVEGARADLVVTMPGTTPITVTSNHGDIHVASVKAAVTATANHGDIELSAVSGPATAHLNNSGSSIAAHSLGSGLMVQGHAQDVTLTDVAGPVSIEGEYFGTTHLQRIAGTVHFRTSRTDLQMQRLDGEIEISPHMELHADQVLGPLVLTTSNRNINLDRVAGDVSVTNKNGSIDLTVTPAIGAITLLNKNGSVKAILPTHAGFSVEASTVDGDISSDFGLNSSGSESHKALNGTVGAGGPAVRITTTHGDISLNKGEVSPLPLLPPVVPRLSDLPVPPAMPKMPAMPRLRMVPGNHAPAEPAAPPAAPAPPAN